MDGRPVLRDRLADRHDERERAWAETSLVELAEELARPDAATSVLEGQVLPTLLSCAAERRALLLVSGTAARAGLDHLLQGSVASRLAAEAPCPVVTVPPSAAIGQDGPVVVGDDGSEHARRAVRHATALADRLRREAVRLQVEDDDPVQVIREAASDHRACLIVTGTRGRGALRTALFGSVSTGLVQTSGRPVMLVGPNAAEPP